MTETTIALPTGLGPQETAIHALITAVDGLDSAHIQEAAQAQADLLSTQTRLTEWSTAWSAANQAVYQAGRGSLGPDVATPIDDAFEAGGQAVDGKGPAELEGLAAGHTYHGLSVEEIAYDAVSAAILALVVRDLAGTSDQAWSLDGYQLLTTALRRIGVTVHPDDGMVAAA